MNKTAIIYARVSTQRQAKDELPIESQIKSCQAKAADLGLTVQKIFKDEGYSASSDQRPAFQDSIVYCEVFEIDYFICWSSSRFARNKRDASYYKDRLDSCNTRLIYVSMDIDISTNQGWLIDSQMELMDEYYSRMSSDDTKRSMIRNAKSGFWNGGSCPYGYKPVPSAENPKRKVLEPVPEEAEVVNMIYRAKLERGLGARQIMKMLNSEGITRRGKEWKLNTIADLLRSYTVIGKTVFGKRPRGKKRVRRPRDQWIIVDSHRPLIDEKLFLQVQDVMDRESNVRNRDNCSNLLTGRVYCGHCDSRMHISSGTGRTQIYYYYYCRAAKLDDSHQFRRYRADLVDQAFIENIKERVCSREALEEVLIELQQTKSGWANESGQRIDRLNREISGLERKNQNLVDIMQELGVAAPNIKQLTETLKRNAELINDNQLRIRQIQTEDIAQMNLELDPVDLAAVIHQVLDDRADLDKIRAFVQSFVKKVKIEDEEMQIKYSPASLLAGPVHTKNGWLPGPGLARTKRIVIEIPAEAAPRRRLKAG